MPCPCWSLEPTERHRPKNWGWQMKIRPLKSLTGVCGERLGNPHRRPEGRREAINDDVELKVPDTPEYSVQYIINSLGGSRDAHSSPQARLPKKRGINKAGVNNRTRNPYLLCPPSRVPSLSRFLVSLSLSVGFLFLFLLLLSSLPRDSLPTIMDPVSLPRSSSRPRPSSRPTTPLRPSSRSSFREAHGYGGSISTAGYTQPAINALEPQFAELADSMADLEANFMHLQLMHESLTRFSESFASFLYGLNMNAFCVDFPEVFHLAVIPTRRVLIPRIGSYSRVFPQSKASRGTERLAESWSHARQITSGNANVSPEAEAEQLQSTNNDGDMTFLYVPSAQSLVQFCSFPLT